MKAFHVPFVALAISLRVIQVSDAQLLPSLLPNILETQIFGGIPTDLLNLKLTLSPLSLARNTGVTCPPPGILGLLSKIIYPDPNDCTSFYVCAGAVVQARGTCFSGYHYSLGLLPLPHICRSNNPAPPACNQCTKLTTPVTCTASVSNCSYCYDPAFNSTRCDTRTNLVNNACPTETIGNTPCKSFTDPTTCTTSPYNCSYCFDIAFNLSRCDSRTNLIAESCPVTTVDNYCITYSDPDACIASPHNCSYCFDIAFNLSRCDSRTNLIAESCPVTTVDNYCITYSDPDACIASPHNCSYCFDIAFNLSRCESRTNLIAESCPVTTVDNYCITYSDPDACIASPHNCSYCFDIAFNLSRCDSRTNLMAESCPVTTVDNYCITYSDPDACIASPHNCSYCFSPTFNGTYRCDSPIDLVSESCPADTINNYCTYFTDPYNCTRSPHNCSFCFDPAFNTSARCNGYEDLVAKLCPVPLIYTMPTPVENRTVDPRDNSTIDPVDISLLPGDCKNFTITFNLAKYPLDFYFLMDISGSMGPYKSNVVELSSAFVATLANFTDDFTVGFGAFSDKCDTYNYQHVMSLTNNTSTFASTVGETALENGCDIPEDHGTAMYEGAFCESQIGWRSFTRRLIFVVSDAIFHQAGDTSLPAFDGLCHLDTSGFYTAKNTLDYPSLNQLVNVMTEKRITTLFGIANAPGNIAFYNSVVSAFPSAALGTLTTSGTNLVDLIRTEYNKIATTVHMTNSPATSEINIKYYSTCKGSADSTETALCSDLPINGEVTFTVEFCLSDCPADPSNWNSTIQVCGGGLSTCVQVPLQLVCQDF